MSLLQELQGIWQNAKEGNLALNLRKVLESKTTLYPRIEALSDYVDWNLKNLDFQKITEEETRFTAQMKVLGGRNAELDLSVKGKQEAGFVFDLTIKRDGKFRVDGMPWLLLSDWKIHVTLSEQGDPGVQGSLETSILVGKVWLPFSVAYPFPTEEIFQASFPLATPTLSDLQPFLGGLRLSGWLEAVSEAKMGISFAYDAAVHRVKWINAVCELNKLEIGGVLKLAKGMATLEVKEKAGEIITRIEYRLDLPSEATITISGEFVNGRWSWTCTSDDKTFPFEELLPSMFRIGDAGLARGVLCSGLNLTIRSEGTSRTHIEGSALLAVSNELELGHPQVQFQRLSIEGDENEYWLTLNGAVNFPGMILPISLAFSSVKGWKSLCGTVSSGSLGSSFPLPDLKFPEASICWNGSAWILKAVVHWEKWGISIKTESSFEYIADKDQFVGCLEGQADFMGIRLEVSYQDDGTIKGKWHDEDIDIQGHKLLLPLKGKSLGWLIKEAVSWVKGRPFGLASPWDLFDDISLPKTQLVLDTQNKFATLEIPIHASRSLGLLEGFKLEYDMNPNVSLKERLVITLKGDILGFQNPSWNPAEPSKTPVPNHLSDAFDLKLLALGQHILPVGGGLGSVEDAIRTMSNNRSRESIQYNPSAGWIIAMDLEILRFISLKFLFNDPQLYALKVGLNKKTSDFMKGLEFEVLYRKITDDIGLYQAEITLPDDLRIMEFGAYTLTLPVFGIAIYTNGDFGLDIGFPYNFDFSRSLTIQTIVPPGIPMIGSAGFYVNKLSGLTSNRLPEARTGSFGPVLELGFGMRVGLGKEIQKGPLKAGFSVTVIGLMEGVLANWRPDGDGEGALYYWLQGIMGIQGRLYGEVDLSLVKASVDVAVTVATAMIYEAYGDLEFSLLAKVDIKLKIKIGKGMFKIKISVSYSAEIKESFVIKAEEQAPWSALAIQQGLALNRDTDKSCNRESYPHLTLHWDNLVSTETESITIYAAPVITLTPDPGSTTGSKAAYVLLFAMETFDDSKDGGQETNGKIPDFEIVCHRFYHWLIAAALGDIKTISVQDCEEKVYVLRERLCQLKKQLSDPESAGPSIPMKALERFLSEYWNIIVRGKHEQCQSSADGQTSSEICLDTIFFPALPGLSVQIMKPDQDNPSVIDKEYRFADAATANAQYLREQMKHFRQSSIETMPYSGKKPLGIKVDMEEEQYSVAEFVLNDYFTSIARQLIQASLDELDDYKYGIGEATTAMEIISILFKHTRNVVFEEGEAGDAHSPEMIQCAIDLFKRNEKVPLRSGTRLFIKDRFYRIQAGDTWKKIAISIVGEERADSFAKSMIKLEENVQNEELFVPASYPRADDPQQFLQVEKGDSLAKIARKLGYPCEEGFACLERLISEYPEMMLRKSAKILLPPYEYAVVEHDTLRTIAQKSGVSVGELAENENNWNTAGIFFAQEVTLGPLKRMLTKDIFERMKKKRVLQQLSGMLSRSFLHGLRLRNREGLNTKLVDSGRMDFGLFELTGQQGEIPHFDKNWSIVLDKPDNYLNIEFKE